MTAADYFGLPPDRISAHAEAEFLASIKQRNGTFKLTTEHRFSDLDDVIIERFGRSEARIATVLDIGVSSGVTTLELHDALRAAGFDVRTTGTDWSITAFLVGALPGLRVLVDETGYPLQYDILGVVLRPWIRQLDYLTGMLVVRAVAARVLAGRARAALTRGANASAVQLVSRRLVGRRDMHILHDDIRKFNPAMAGNFDFIRAANVLNRNYFSDRDLRHMLSNVRKYVSGPGAHLLTVRSRGAGDHQGTLFCYGAEGRFEVVDRFGSGSEVESIVLSLHADEDEPAVNRFALEKSDSAKTQLPT